MKTTTQIVVIILSIALSWILTCGIFWAICWAISCFGITDICGWTVAFSWKIATAFWILCTCIKTLFGFGGNK